MFIALRDLWRSKLRFGLLTGAVGLLVFLLLFLNTLSATLLNFFIGAIENNSADVLVYKDTARRNLQASRLDASLIEDVAAVPGVAAAAPVGELTLTARVDGALTDLSLWGVDLDGPGGPAPIVEGRSPGPGEVVVDESGISEGFEIGETITLVPSGTELEIVGFVRDRRYAVIATGYLAFAEWVSIFETEFPGTPLVPLSLIAVAVDEGEDPAAVGEMISATVPGVEGLDRTTAAQGTPGVDSISQSFNLIVGITFGIVVLVVAFFFLILTVQKLRSFVALRAIGAGTAYLARSLIIQVVTLVTLGSIIGAGLLWLATLGANPAFPLAVDGRLVLTAAVAVLGASMLAALLSVRRIARADPAEAAQGTR
jgi:putative ABC transport system permease protein